VAITPGGRVGDASPTGHKGGKRQLSDYERELWHALVRRGVPEKKAYRMARGILRNALGGKWGRGRIRNPAVQAGAYASMAQRAAIKAHNLAEPLDLAELTAKKRRKLKRKQFAIPETRSYPIHDRAHARNALARVAQHGTPAEKRRVKAAVHARYTDLADVHGYLEQHYPPRVIGWAKAMKWKRRRVPLEQIQMAARPGKPHDPGKVAAIRKAIRKGKPMKPVVLVNTGTGLHKIADGYHRTAALKAEGRTAVDAYVARTRKRRGPWSRAMHDAKLNV
jgi:hypothetical protein